MSNYQSVKATSSQREVDEYTRLQTLLADRNKSLQAAERLNKKYEIAAKCSQNNMRALMAFFVACILLFCIGGDI